MRSAPGTKLIDALGMLRSKNNMELIIVEASSGSPKENTTHIIEDSLKIIECSVASLRKEATHYKHASLETFKSLKVFSLHVIKTQVTLSEMSLYNEKYWRFVEKRTAKLSTCWSDRLYLAQYLELMATLFDGIRETGKVQHDLLKESLGRTSYEGPSVESISEDISLV